MPQLAKQDTNEQP